MKPYENYLSNENSEKLYDLANQPKYSYFPKYDDHMMEFNKDLIQSINQFIKSLN